MERIIEQGTLPAFFRWDSAFHRLCKATYERRPPRPFQLRIMQSDPDDLRLPRYGKRYSADELLALPHTEWQQPIHDFAKALEKTLFKRRRYRLSRIHLDRRDVVFGSMESMTLNGLHVTRTGTISKIPPPDLTGKHALAFTYTMFFMEPTGRRDYAWDDRFTVGTENVKFDCEVRQLDDERDLDFYFCSRDHYFTFDGRPGAAVGPLYIAV